MSELTTADVFLIGFSIGANLIALGILLLVTIMERISDNND